MSDIVEKLAEVGIRLPNYQPGDRKITCPKCSHERRHQKDPCLSVHVDPDGENATWMCHHCDWRGATRDVFERPQAPRRPPQLQPPPRLEQPEPRATEGLYDWFDKRCIPRSVVDDAKIVLTSHYFASLGRAVPAIAFPYFRGGELVNTKYRALNHKAFSQDKGGLQCFYGLDELCPPDEIFERGPESGCEQLIIVEGELDKLAADACELLNCISVPDGAPAKLKDEVRDDDAKFQYLALDHEVVDRYHKIVLAVDADGPGDVLAEELARRLGKERCFRVRWPESNDVRCKDLNDTLLQHGEKAVHECIENAVPYPVQGYHLWDEDGLRERKMHARERGLSIGWSGLDPHMTISPGQLSVVTGVPNHGKSEFVDAVVVNLAMRHGWKFALCSFENSIYEHEEKLAEKYLGIPFWDGPTRQGMTLEDIAVASEWGKRHFTFIRAEEEPPTIDWLLEKARIAVLRDGVQGLVIDPYNEIEHARPSNMTETEYVSQILGRVKRFAQCHGVHVWFVAHPAKMHRENGKVPVPNLYDISGSAHWANKADIGITIYRPDVESTDVEVHIQKVRHKWVGRPGKVVFEYDRITGRYSEPEVRSHWTDR